MNRIRHTYSLVLIFLLVGLGLTAQAQRLPYNSTDYQARQLIRRIDDHTNAFRNNLDTALDQSRIDGTRREDNINAFVADFENATSQLRDRVNNRQSV